jgi:hypothetical protein
MKNGHTLLGACAVSVAAFVPVCPALAGEVKTWNRDSDWHPGLTPGSTVGNPAPGSIGPLAWRYESTSGGPLGSVNPWYTQPRTLLKWDDQWWATGQGAWAGNDDISPAVMQDRIIHNLHTSTYANIPVVSWINTMGDGTLVDISGSMRLRWTGGGGVGFPVDVDLVLARQNILTGATTLLYAQTLSKPTPSPSVEEEMLIPFDFADVSFDQNDTLILTHRGREAFGPLGMWVTVFDQGMTVTLVPTPGAVTAIGMAGLALTRRRRR